MHAATTHSVGNSHTVQPHDNRGPVQLGVCLTRQFPLAPVSLVLDSPRVANGIAGRQWFTHVSLTSDDDPVISSCNFPAVNTVRIDQSPSLDVPPVCLGDASLRFSEPQVLR